ncbi:MAG: 23S rRNA (pseudouridine(1915)-N(3))-methyltransferase RlmH [Litorivicinus sp.]
MHHHLLCVGHKAPAWVNEGIEHYGKRLRPGLKTQLLAPSKHSDSERRKADEARLIEAKLPKGAWVVALDERGRQFTSRELSSAYAKWVGQGQPVAFVIGGADGLHDDIRDRANALWGLSNLTLPHALVRVFIAESLYRSQALLAGHPYHRD